MNSAYLATTKSSVNLRADSTTSSTKLATLPAGSFLYLDKRQSSSGFYRVIAIESGMEGYVSKAYVDLDTPTFKMSTGNIKQVKQSTAAVDPKVTIYNDTDRNLTVKMGTRNISIKPHQSKTVTVKAGTCYYVASAVRCQSYVGRDLLRAGSEYEWHFVIVSKFGGLF